VLINAEALAIATVDTFLTDPVRRGIRFTPVARPTSAIERSSSRTIATALLRNSGGYFEGLPAPDRFLGDMDFR
jgi:hypothetical protein